MKKSILILLAMVCSLLGCNNDDKEPLKISDQDVNGVYLGALDIDAGELIQVQGIKQKIYLTRTGEKTMKMELKNFSFEGLSLGDIIVNNVDIVKEPTSCSFKGSDKVQLAVGECAVNIEGTVNNSGSLTMKINVLAAETLEVKVKFAGQKMAEDKSSDARILTFTIDNEHITSIPKIDDANKVISFFVSDQIPVESLKALVPTFTISEGAKVDLQSGVAQDFSKEVQYTVTSEDGIVKNIYRVVVSGKNMVLRFDNWQTINGTTSGSKESYKVPEGLFGSSNPGICTINEMFGSNGAIFDYCVSPVEGKMGQAAQIKTVYTYVFLNGTDFNKILGGLIPYVTAGSLFTGSFKTDMGNPLNSTKFGIPCSGEPTTFSGWYKYSPGTKYYNNDNTVIEEKTDKCSIYAVVYEEELDNEGNNIPLTGDYKNTEAYIGSSSRIIMKAELADGTEKSDWTEFSVPFKMLNGKTYDSNKNYYIAVVCSSSFEGDYYKGAPGSVLEIDEFNVTMK